MPRPRKYTILISELKCFETLKSELQSMPGLDDFNIENASLTFKQRKPPYTVKPENLEKPMHHSNGIFPKMTSPFLSN